MQHWHAAMPGAIHDVSYEALVSDTEGTARQLLAYCGLEFESRCLDTASNTTPTATLSTNQVREPIHRRGLQEWRRLRAAVGAAAPGLAAGPVSEDVASASLAC